MVFKFFPRGCFYRIDFIKHNIYYTPFPRLFQLFYCLIFYKIFFIFKKNKKKLKKVWKYPKSMLYFTNVNKERGDKSGQEKKEGKSKEKG